MGADESPPFFLFLEMKSEMVEEKQNGIPQLTPLSRNLGILIYDVAF